MSKELIEKFLANKCTREEAEQIAKEIGDNPDLMEKYFGQNEWDQIDNSIQFASETTTQKMLDAVEKSTYKKNHHIIRMAYRAAAAAVIILALGLFWINKQNNTPPTIAKQETTITQQLQAQLKVVKNNDQKEIKALLPDGSTINIKPGSLIKYNERFDGSKREVYLEGEAFFSVAKNKNRPFIVYSKDISTTALGTSFTIKAYNQDEHVTVRLYTGKVVVKQTDDAKRMQDIYLIPGQEISVNTQTFETVISHNNDNPDKIIPEAISHEPITIHKEEHIAGTEFNNEPLQNVLRKIEEIYKISVQYKDEDIDNLDFTGSIDKSEPAENILQNIALLNGFTLTKTSTGYLFQKNQ